MEKNIDIFYSICRSYRKVELFLVTKFRGMKGHQGFMASFYENIAMLLCVRLYANIHHPVSLKHTHTHTHSRIHTHPFHVASSYLSTMGVLSWQRKASKLNFILRKWDFLSARGSTESSSVPKYHYGKLWIDQKRKFKKVFS